MYTRCPSCGAIFRIVRAQLEARAGLVRCGHCRRTFNASWNLLDSLPPGVSDDAAPVDSPPPSPALQHAHREGATASTGASVTAQDAAPAADSTAKQDDVEAVNSQGSPARRAPELPAFPLFEIPEIFRRRKLSAKRDAGAPGSASAKPDADLPPRNDDESGDVVTAQQPSAEGVQGKGPAQATDPGSGGAADSASPGGEPEGGPGEDEKEVADLPQVAQRTAGGDRAERTDSPAAEDTDRTPAQELPASTGSPPLQAAAYPEWVPDEEIVLQSAYEDWTDSASAGAQRSSAAPGHPTWITRDPRGNARGAHGRESGQGVGRGAAAGARSAAAQVIASLADDVSLVELPQRRWRLGILWWFAALALTAALLAQARYLYLDELAQVPRLRPLLHEACELLDCDVPARSAPQLVDLLETGVTNHPSVPGALRVTVTLANRASFAQPYPPLQVTLSDRSGEVVGRRTYSPSAYLQVGDALMPARSAQDVVLDLTNPAQSAIGYEVRLAAP